MKEALLYKKLEENNVLCSLCAHRCRIAEDKFGICGVRQNVEGILYTHAYGRVIAAAVDPVEKKPLYHFLPGTASFSIATAGCNFRCGFCQNWQISQLHFSEPRAAISGDDLSVEGIIDMAMRSRCQSISYTYTEPTIFFEYAYETAKAAKLKGLYNIFVTNGYMTKECLTMAGPYLDAANVDLKFFRDESYRNICGASLKPVLDSIRLMHKLGIWVEITTLVIPGENDSQEELKDIAGFIASIDKNIPWHVSRFHPDYNFARKTHTPPATLIKAQEIGYQCGLNFIYIGNISGPGNNTNCPHCKKLLIKREIFEVLEYNMKKGRCGFCNAKIPGVFIR